MKTIKVIDLLNKIANGEEVPKKIKYRNNIYEYEDSDYFGNDIGYLFERYNSIAILNDEVEIIEENKIPEKLKWVDYNTEFTHGEFNKEFRNICNTIDEIIDYFKSKGE
jgi:hypothetical protein